MTLEEAIQRYFDKERRNRIFADCQPTDTREKYYITLADEDGQIAKWLEELKSYREGKR